MVRRVQVAVALCLASLGTLGTARHVVAHPLHSTITELVLDPARGTVRATVRVFADDVRSAVAHAAQGRAVPPDGPAWDAALLSYATSTLALRDARGTSLSLRACGTRRTGDLLWICLEADVARNAAQLEVRNAMLCELYEDQVNIVQGTVGGTRRSLLFVRGDRYKPFR